MNQTPVKLTYIIVFCIAFLATIGVSSLCLALFVHIYADQTIMATVNNLTAMLVGSLVTLLTSTRSQATPAQTDTTTTTTTSSTLPAPQAAATVQPVVVTNLPSQPVPTTTEPPKP